MILFRPICFSVVLGVFASPACAALEQNTSETPITTLKANSRVVLLDVVVTDKQGNPVRDIRADDLKVFEDGKLQKLSSFALVDKASPAMAAPPAELGPGIYYNRQGLETQNGQFTVLLLVMAAAAGWIDTGAWIATVFLIVFITVIASGAQYVWLWGRKAISESRTR